MAPDTEDPRPSPGRERTVDALVESAIELFGRSGPDAVSLRDVASHAGVNYGLIHQYVGTKDELIRLALTRLSQRSSERLRSEPPMASMERLLAGREASPSLRLLTWAILQRRDGPELLAHSPAIEALVDGMVESKLELDPAVARRRAVAAMATVLGWQMYGSYLRTAAGLGDDDAQGIATVLSVMLDGVLMERIDVPSKFD